MKRFLVLALIYSLNILMFLFAKSAGAAEQSDRALELKMVKAHIAYILQGSGRSPAVVTRLVGKR